MDELRCPRCNETVDEHPANRCLDAWVAEVVMGLPPREHAIRWEQGWTPEGDDGWSGFQCSYCDASEKTDDPCVRHYSRWIAEAWEVVEKLSGLGVVSVASGDDRLGGLHMCEFIPWGCYMGRGGLLRIEADTYPLAICRAALKAVGHG